jgi:stage II sporulation protein AB (anti-sigma F factor)
MLTDRAPSSTLDVKIPADPKYVGRLRKRIEAFAAKHRLDPGETREFITAIGEAVANAIEHSQAESIEVSCWLDGNRKLLATVSDAGRGFVRIPEGIELPPPQAERGRGLPIMRRYCDLFRIRSAPGKGTTVFLGRILRRPGGKAD